MDATKRLLAAGIVAGPLFIIVVVFEMLTRTGFDLMNHAISMLSLGDRGWVMITTFMFNGLLTLLFVVGLWRTLRKRGGGKTGTFLLGIYGMGLIAAGIFSADPGNGFPPGPDTPVGMPEVLSTEATIHNFVFMITFLSLIASCFLFAYRFFSIRQKGWASLFLILGIAIPVLIALGINSVIAPGVGFFIATLFAWIFIVILAIRMMTELPGRVQA